MPLTTPQSCLEGEGGCLRSPPPLQTTPPPHRGQQEEAALRSGFPAHHSNDAGDPKWLTVRGPQEEAAESNCPLSAAVQGLFRPDVLKTRIWQVSLPKAFKLL